MPHQRPRSYSDQEWASVISGSWHLDEPTWDMPMLTAKTRINTPWLGREYGNVYRNLVCIDRRTFHWLRSVLGPDQAGAGQGSQQPPRVRQSSSSSVH